MARLLQFLEDDYRKRRYDNDPETFRQLRVSVNVLAKFLGREVCLEDLSDELMLSWLAWLKQTGRSPRTINNKRASIITLWRAAVELGLISIDAPDGRRVRRAKQPRRNPTAWKIDELQRLVAACEDGPRHDGWDGRHWKALVLACYDTGERLNAILQATVSHLDQTRGTLFIPAEFRKGRTEDKLHRLHSSTVGAINETLGPWQKLLFPWPVARRAIWPEFKLILRGAGLPSSRRDLFHKLRRTGYTYLWCSHGPHAAAEFAGHHDDLSRYYLDRTFLPALDPLDALPRPV